MKIKLGFALAAMLACLWTASVMAQPQQYDTPQQGRTPDLNRPGQQQRGQQQSRTASSGQNQGVEQFLASCWQAKNQAEIEISKLAQRQARDPQVKQFAQQMVQDHQQLSQKLQQITGMQSRPDQSGTSDQTRGQSGAIGKLISIEQQIVERQTQAIRQKLDQKSGPEFDKCYLAGQIACHMQASAALEVISKQASGELKQLASQTKSKIDSHLKKAEQLFEQMDKSSTQQAGTYRDSDVRPASAIE